MKGFRVFVAITLLLLIAGIGFLVFFIHARMTATEYLFQVDAVLSAASVVNQDQPLTDSDKAVISEYEGQRYVIVPGNYLALSSYLRKDASMPLFLNIDREKALKITVCDESVFYLVPEQDSGDVVLIRLEAGNRVFQMRTDGGNQWSSLLRFNMPLFRQRNQIYWQNRMKSTSPAHITPTTTSAAFSAPQV